MRMRSPLTAWRSRRDRRRLDSMAITAALRHLGELSVAEIVTAVRLPPPRVYRAVRLLHRHGEVLYRLADEPAPRRRLYRIPGRDSEPHNG